MGDTVANALRPPPIGYRAAPIYNEAIVKKCVIAAMFWGVVAFLVGVYIATELAWPQFNLGLSYVNFGRLRPVHTPPDLKGMRIRVLPSEIQARSFALLGCVPLR